MLTNYQKQKDACCIVFGEEQPVSSHFTENMEGIDHDSENYEQYKNFSSEDLIAKVEEWCSSYHMSSAKYAVMRETLRNRIEDLNRYMQNPSDLNLNNYSKQLHTKLLTSLNNLDRFWGYYDVRGFGMNYGIKHCELGDFHLKSLRKLNIAIECLKKVAEKTNNKDCKKALDLIYRYDLLVSKTN